MRRCGVSGRAKSSGSSQCSGQAAGWHAVPDIVVLVSATWAYDETPRLGHPLLPGASPAAIRAALLPQDREPFDAAYEEALVQARESLDLTELFKATGALASRSTVAKQPRGLSTGRTPVVRQAAEAVTGQPVPENEPVEVTRARAGL